MAAATTPQRARRTAPLHRPDIDALRALAIVLVIGYHAHVPKLDGGFVGVDVFFVISGFLITRNLLHEHQAEGRIALRSFWARRLRRLVPAMSAMVLVTMALGVLVLVPLQWPELAAQGLTASLYVSNLHFASVTGDYFAAPIDASPLLHTWSLAVEEQFYVVWPVLIGLALRAATRVRRPTLVVTGVLLVVAAASFAWSCSLVARSNVHAFYGLPSRTWEFALAGLLAVAVKRWEGRPVLPPVASVALSLAGLGAIVWSVGAYDATTAFPGAAALPPVLGTAAIVAAGSLSPVTWRLAVAPVRWLGRISYSWYLWHWPAMVLAVAWLDRDTITLRLAAALASLAVAQVSFSALEDPIRRAPRLVTSRPATFGVAASFTLVAVGSTILVGVRHEAVLGGDFHGQIASAAEKRYLDDCAWSTPADGIERCTLGDVDAERTLVLAGDSHAMSWAPAFHLAGQRLGLRVIVRAANTCPGVPIPTMSDLTGGLNASCMAYRDDTLRLVDELRPELMVTVSSDLTRRAATPDGVRIADRLSQLAAWSDALGDLRDRLAGQGTTLGAVLDNPRVARNPLVCMEEEGDEEVCTPPRYDAVRRVRLHVENELRTLGAPATLDTIGMSCDDERCAIREGDRYAYADSTHLSADFTEAHVDDVVEFVERLRALGERPQFATSGPARQTGGP
jgi:peptidoglycan/LPS O-acetylase OafA/YrhL